MLQRIHCLSIIHEQCVEHCCQSTVVLQAKIYSALLRQFYRDLTTDYTTSSNLSEKEMDLHIAHVIDMELSDPDQSRSQLICSGQAKKVDYRFQLTDVL